MNIFTAVIPAALAVAIAGPAAAAPQGESREHNARVVERNGERLYCVSERITGSLIPRSTCRTEGEWAQLGASVRDPKKNDKAFASTAR